MESGCCALPECAANGRSLPGAVSTQLLWTRTKLVGRFSKSFLGLSRARSQTRTALCSHDLRSDVHCLRKSARLGKPNKHVDGRWWRGFDAMGFFGLSWPL